MAFYDCGFVSVQDTLTDLTWKHYYKDCLLEAAIDFIFGYGLTVFQIYLFNIELYKIG